MKEYKVVEVEPDNGYHRSMVSEDGENTYLWGYLAGRSGMQNMINHYASQGWELVQVIHPSETLLGDYRVIFVRNV